jgi:LmbE family N-acetylglucosaminyl deacetylase
MTNGHWPSFVIWISSFVIHSDFRFGHSDSAMISFASFANFRHVLCLGAHCDDIEIGAGGTILRLIARHPNLKFHWVVFGGKNPERVKEATASAAAFCPGATFDVQSFEDSFFQYSGEAIKRHFLAIRQQFPADVVFTHHGDDRHQDHRLINEFTWNTFRDHQILEYETPKWDGDLSRPTLYYPLSAEIVQQKVDLLMQHFGTQRSRHWFTPDTFRGLMRLRGLECNAPSGYAEAFHSRKIVLS